LENTIEREKKGKGGEKKKAKGGERKSISLSSVWFTRKKRKWLINGSHP